MKAGPSADAEPGRGSHRSAPAGSHEVRVAPGDDRTAPGDDRDDAGEAPLVVPITGELDLHAFAPSDVPSVVADYVEACREAGVRELRLVHGRGRGVQRAVVRRVLGALAGVRDVRDAPPGSGGWGATLARLSDDSPREKRANPGKTE